MTSTSPSSSGSVAATGFTTAPSSSVDCSPAPTQSVPASPCSVVPSGPADRWPRLTALDQEEAHRSGLVAAWRVMRSQGIPAGSQARPVAALREELLRLGLWEEVYRE